MKIAKRWRGASLALVISGSLSVSHAGVSTPPPAVPTIEAATPTMSEAQALLDRGKFAGAAKAFKAITDAEPNNARAWFGYAYALHAAGDLEEAIGAHKKAAEFPAFGPVATYNLGCAHALLGHPDPAFEALVAAAEMGEMDLAQYENDSDLKSLHEDDRWEPLLQRVRELTENPLPRALRFWVGEWDVYDRQGNLAGNNKITLRDNGRVIYEVWRSRAGTGGESFNYFEPVSRTWKQVWVDASGNVLEMAGTYRDGAVRFEGHELLVSGQTVAHRTTLGPHEERWVRQHIQRSTDGGATWQTAYDFIYVPTGEPYKVDMEVKKPG